MAINRTTLRLGIRKAGSGFTIVEAIVGMSIFLVVMFGVYLVLETCQATFWRAEAKADIQQNARFALERMRRELSMTGYDPSATGQAAVQNPTSMSVEFIADVDGNNLSELVKYDRNSATRTIRRTVKSWTGSAWGTATVTTVAAHVDALTFQYSPSSSVPGLKRIQVMVSVSEQISFQPVQQHQVTTDVFLRNL
jgi:Tfp pilus assembly protein PilW